MTRLAERPADLRPAPRRARAPGGGEVPNGCGPPCARARSRDPR